MEDKSGTRTRTINTVRNIANTNPTVSIIILVASGLHIPMKRQRLSDWIEKQDPNVVYKKPT